MTKRRPPRPQEIAATVTFLAMDGRPSHPPPPSPLLKAALLRSENPPVHFYRYLYDAVGRDYVWVERRLWSDAKLKEALTAEGHRLYVLYIGGVPAGMAEIDFREGGIANIAYFGLVPEFTGRKIGPWFLHQIIELCWAEPINRLLVNTCTLDNKKALVTYQRAGFAPYARSERYMRVPADFPLPAHLR